MKVNKGGSANQAKELLYPLSAKFRLQVSEKVAEAWRAVEVPQTDTDLDKVRARLRSELASAPADDPTRATRARRRCRSRGCKTPPRAPCARYTRYARAPARALDTPARL